MRIAYFLTSLGIGGAEHQIVGLAHRMQLRGHSVKLLILRPEPGEPCATVLDPIYLNLHKDPFTVVRGLQRARRVLACFKPDVVHCNNFHGNLFGRSLSALMPGLRVISTVHNVHEGGWLRMRVYELTGGLSARTVAVCSAAADRAVRTRAVAPEKCSVVPNGIDVETFTPDELRREDMRSRMEVGHGFVWMAAGRVVPAKNYANLLHAFAQLMGEEPTALLWIAGEDGGAYAARMRALAADLRVTDRVRWLGLRRDIPALLDGADGFVLGSAWEGMPLALGEAMAMKKPFVATDVGGVRELAGDAGIIVPAGDAKMLAQAMLRIMRMSASERMQLGNAARTRVCERFSLEAAVRRWEGMYQAMMN